ncbi:MAG TPA: DUF1015 domain-containing protein [Lachnospiraceae bacterium]|nr:DUF1015 domain-containing protein [Lachnospiraceae bacterium]
MSTIKEFKAIRPTAKTAQQVAALPYDVMNSTEARNLVEGNPLSFLHVDRAEIDLPPEIDHYSTDVYKKAAENLNSLIKDNVLLADEMPCLYIYRLTMNGHSQTGLVACTSIDEYLDGTIKKHELTREDKEQDRINHVDYCNANTGPIFLAYKDEKNTNAIINQWASNHAPVYDFVSSDGIGHAVWVIDDTTVIAQLKDTFNGISNFYIADGHHRNASAVKVGLNRRKQHPNYTGKEEFNYYLSVLFPASQLNILDYNRVITDLNGLTEDNFIELISKKFYIIPYAGSDSFKPTMPHQFGMYLKGKWYILNADPEGIPTDPVGRLDVSILQENLLIPILGIKDVRTDNRIDFIGGIRGLKELERRVNSGEMAVAFSMYPTSMDELMNVADADLIMPPKSTWFEPKLRSGLFIHSLEN